MKNTTTLTLLSALLLGATLGGCLDEETAPADLDDEPSATYDKGIDAVPLATCLPPSTPAPPSADSSLDTANLGSGKLYKFDDYGGSACSLHTQRVYGQNMAAWIVQPAIPEPMTSSSCVKTRSTIYVDRKPLNGTWTRELAEEKSGKWSASGCELPVWEGRKYHWDDVRITTRVVTTCDAPYCFQLYGRPVWLLLSPASN